MPGRVFDFKISLDHYWTSLEFWDLQWSDSRHSVSNFSTFQVFVPDAFDLRPDVPNCDCFPDAFTCHHCCDRSLGHRGEGKCWGDQRRLETVWTYDENPEVGCDMPFLSQIRAGHSTFCILWCPVHNAEFWTSLELWPLRHHSTFAVAPTTCATAAGLLSIAPMWKQDRGQLAYWSSAPVPFGASCWWMELLLGLRCALSLVFWFLLCMYI